MRRSILLTGSLFFILTFTLISCGGGNSKTANSPSQKVQDQYRCPMKCTEEIFDKPGKCPVCEMELEKVTNS